MSSENSVNSNENLQFTLRMDKKIIEIVDYLQDKTLLTKSGVVKLALTTLYKQEKIKESQIKGGIKNE